MVKIMQSKHSLSAVFFVLILILLVSSSFDLSGCSFAPLSKPYMYNSRLLPGKFSYNTSLKNWTRKVNIYNRFDTVMLLRATYFNAPFRYAYVMEYSKYYMLTKKGFKKRLDKSYSSLNKYIKFFVSVYTPLKDYNDLDSVHSIWLVYLMNDKGESLLPISIKPAPQKRVFLKTFFPYVTDWSKQYIIKFPRYYSKSSKKLLINPSTEWIKLIITGVSGRAVLKWNFNN